MGLATIRSSPSVQCEWNMSVVVVINCPRCGKTNRVPRPRVHDRPHCGSCGARLDGTQPGSIVEWVTAQSRRTVDELRQHGARLRPHARAVWRTANSSPRRMILLWVAVAVACLLLIWITGVVHRDQSQAAATERYWNELVRLSDAVRGVEAEPVPEDLRERSEVARSRASFYRDTAAAIGALGTASVDREVIAAGSEIMSTLGLAAIAADELAFLLADAGANESLSRALSILAESFLRGLTGDVSTVSDRLHAEEAQMSQQRRELLAKISSYDTHVVELQSKLNNLRADLSGRYDREFKPIRLQ